MITKLDERMTLLRLLERFDELDTHELVVFAAGYEAGRVNKSEVSSRKYPEEHTNPNPRQA